MKLGTVNIDGRTFDVEVEDNGDFVALFMGERIDATSKKALVEKLKKLVRTRARLAIPATLVETRHHHATDREQITFTQVILVGIHGRNRNVLYRNEKHPETTEQEGWSEKFCRRLTGDEIQEGYRLYRAQLDAQRVWENWQEAHYVNVKVLIEEEVERLAAQPMEQASREAEEAEP